MRPIWLSSLLAAALVIGCTEKLVAPDRTPFTYDLYAGNGLVNAAPPLYLGWTEEPVYLGASDTTATFDLGKADSVEFITITMNLNVERLLREGVSDVPGEVWIDAIRDVQTGKYLGADPDGTIHGTYDTSYLAISSLDGLPSRTKVLVNGPGPDLQVFARPVPEHLRTTARPRSASGERTVTRMRPTPF
jgi:hypothetical protein